MSNLMCFHCGLSCVQGSNACCAKASEQPQSLMLGYSAFQMNPLSWVVASWRLYMKMMNQRMHALHHWTYSFIAMKSHFETRAWHANSEGFERLLYCSGSVKCIFFGCVCVILCYSCFLHTCSNLKYIFPDPAHLLAHVPCHRSRNVSMQSQDKGPTWQQIMKNPQLLMNMMNRQQQQDDVELPGLQVFGTRRPAVVKKPKAIADGTTPKASTPSPSPSPPLQITPRVSTPPAKTHVASPPAPQKPPLALVRRISFASDVNVTLAMYNVVKS